MKDTEQNWTMSELIDIVIKDEEYIPYNIIPESLHEVASDLASIERVIKEYWGIFETLGLKEAILSRIIEAKRNIEVVESEDDRSHDRWYHIIYQDEKGDTYVHYTSNTDFGRCPICGSIDHNELECYVNPRHMFWIYREVGDRKYLVPVRKISKEE